MISGMDISRQVFRRSMRMGLLYVVLSFILGLVWTVVFDLIGGITNNITQGGTTVNVGPVFSYILIPLWSLAGLIIATPVFFLFVYDKNAGVLEYLLAVGMSQRDVFKGYLKAALALCVMVMVPMILLNVVISPNGPLFAATAGGISLITGIADVAFVTVLMTAFSSMQRRPSGMNSPLGVGVGIIPVFPSLVLGAILGSAALWFDVVIALAVLVVAILLLLSLDRLIMREKLLP
jgi:hypothetical protein